MVSSSKGVKVMVCGLDHSGSQLFNCHICNLSIIVLCVCACVMVQVQDSLKNLAERRTDIFGVEETLIGQKVIHNT